MKKKQKQHKTSGADAMIGNSTPGHKKARDDTVIGNSTPGNNKTTAEINQNNQAKHNRQNITTTPELAH